MEKIYRGKTYSTNDMTVVKKVVDGVFGDPKGYEETLYQAKDGNYFLYTFGGCESKYSEEKLVFMTKPKLKEWQQNNK